MADEGSDRSFRFDDESRADEEPSRRDRGRSALRVSSLVSIGLGVVMLAFSVATLYQPESANPLEVTTDPLFGLTGIAGLGIMMVLFGLLGYFYSVKAGL